MEIETKKIGDWVVQAAQVSTATRRNSMSSVLDTYLRRKAAEVGIEDYKKFLSGIQETPESYETITEEAREFYDMAGGLGAWIMVAACVKPYISIDTWLTLADETVNELSSAAMELNPQWSGVTPAQEKKTKKRQRKSTKGLAT